MYIKLLRENAKIPTKGSIESAGYDLYAATDYDIEIKPHSTVKIGTGIAIQCPSHYFAGIFARSGLATKQGLRPANCVGVVDADYRGEIIVALHNDTDESKIVCSGERIAQMIIIPYNEVSFTVVNELSVTERGDGGYGSTGQY